MRNSLAIFVLFFAVTVSAQVTVSVYNSGGSAYLDCYCLGNGYPQSDKYAILVFNPAFGFTNTTLMTDSLLSKDTSGNYNGTIWVTDGTTSSDVQTYSGSSGSFVFGWAGAPPVFTNYTAICQNNLGVPAIATLTWNGATVEIVNVPTGGSITWVSPPVEVSPVQGPANFSCDMSAQSTSVTYTNGQAQFSGGSSSTLSADGQGNGFTNIVLTTTTPDGTTSGGGSAALSTNAPTLTFSSATNLNAIVPSTNQIIYQAPSGSASESTLEAVGSVLNSDLANILSGENILNSSMLTWEKTETNQLGQVVTLLMAATNSDSPAQIVAAITNLQSHLSATNNVSVNFPTNLTLSITNFATETTQQGISNLLSQFFSRTNIASTNGSVAMWSLIPASATNLDAAQDAAAAAEPDYGWDNFIAQLTPSLPPATVDAPNMTMDFCGYVIDLDPVHQFPTVAAFTLIGFKIVAELFFLVEVSRMFWELVKAKGATQTGGVPDLDIVASAEVLGFGGAVGGNFIGAIVAVLIPAVFIGGFSLAMAYIFSNLGISLSDAMGITAFSTGMGSMAYYLLSSFIPVNLLFSLLCTRITLQFTIANLYNVAGNVARFLWGK